MMPWLLRGFLRRDARGEPLWSRYFVARPPGEESSAEIEYRAPPSADASFAEIAASITKYRSQLHGRLSVSIADGVVSHFGPWSAREIAYRWLAEDLFAIGWANSPRIGADF